MNETPEKHDPKKELMREIRRKGGYASVLAMRAKLGDRFVEYMREIASRGGKASYAKLPEEERKRRCANGGRASWKKLTPEQALAKRRKGALRRWGRNV